MNVDKWLRSPVRPIVTVGLTATVVYMSIQQIPINQTLAALTLLAVGFWFKDRPAEKAAEKAAEKEKEA